jgi:hypothetical protein
MLDGSSLVYWRNRLSEGTQEGIVDSCLTYKAFSSQMEVSSHLLAVVHSQVSGSDKKSRLIVRLVRLKIPAKKSFYDIYIKPLEPVVGS